MSTHPPPTLGLRHVALLCEDVERMERFYVDTLGYRVEWRPDGGSVYLTNGADNLALHADPKASASESRLDHMGILLRAQPDVDAWHDRLVEHGTQIAAPPKTHRDGCRSFYAYDPERNKIQFIWHPTLSSRNDQPAQS